LTLQCDRMVPVSVEIQIKTVTASIPAMPHFKVHVTIRFGRGARHNLASWYPDRKISGTQKLIL
jgi:hypothetical protein